MEFEEHIKLYKKNKKRMCKTMSRETCNGCPICYTCECMDESDLVENYNKVAEWVAAHPEKTYRMDFKERFPNMDEEFFFDGCRCRIYGYPDKSELDREGCPKGIDNCDECWDVEMEVD